MTRWEPLPLLFLCVDLNQSLDLALKEPFIFNTRTIFKKKKQLISFYLELHWVFIAYGLYLQPAGATLHCEARASLVAEHGL